MCSTIKRIAIVLLICGVAVASADAAGLTISAGSDLVSRYNWRGLDLGNAFSLQPALKCQAGGWKAGFWGSYSSAFDEIDTWTSYTASTPSAGSFTALVTDYYYPASGIRYFNFNNYDNEAGPGAHLIELGFSWSGPASFPITVSGYFNAYNDAGNNSYLQVDYATKVQDLDFTFWIGATPGSSDNPVFYGSSEWPVDDLQVINIGLKATRAIKFSEENEFPLSVAFILNPQQEISYLVLSVSL